uniref:sarcosine oxidase subunit alpha family protein n=1 Tax=Pararhizobium sp. IMCC3301 TaxID=3067904 RepID=UPI002740952C|nr:sarcosine oxidase subunit alpha family protein [Pararhizobium sp. IMCC3301]
MTDRGQDKSLRTAKGGRINRDRPVRFSFENKVLTGFEGDTLASALLANGQHMVARSFKYHRPRGIVAAGSEDPAAIVQIGNDPVETDPNTRVTEQEIYDGLAAKAQNCWPGLAFDIGIANDAFSDFFPAGFYYKTFMGPPLSWMRFEPFIRKAAGLGVAPTGGDPAQYDTTNRHADVLVVGAGSAGLAAAKAAADAGARVIVAEETNAAGGALLSEPDGSVLLGGKPASAAIDKMIADLEANPEVTFLTRTTAFGYYSDNFVGLWERVTDHLPPSERDSLQPRQRIWRVRARQVILATGSLERPMVFDGNDRPGIMLAGAVRSFLHRYGVLCGRKAVIFANNDSAWATAFDLQAAGAEIAAIVDLRRKLPGDLLQMAAERAIPIYSGSAIVATKGRSRVAAADIRLIDESGAIASNANWVDCDLIANSCGWAPNVAMFSQSRGKLLYDDDLQAFRPGKSWQNERSVGAANGAYDLQICLDEGRKAGAAAAAETGFKKRIPRVLNASDTMLLQRDVHILPQIPSPKPAGKVRAFLDLQDDVTTKDIRIAIQEGLHSVEHIKRYTTTGMGTDQGKIANLNAFAFIAGHLGKSVPEVGVTTFRQPYKPVTMGALAGQHVGPHFMPRRTTAMHPWHRAQSGVIFEPVGDWLRPRAFLQGGEDFHQAVQRETNAARTAIGVLDASTLGKIDVRGPDAREFLNRIYTNAWSKLAPGKCRYGLMLKEDGMVMDDGVTACLDDDHFHMTTTTGGAANVLAHLEDYLQTEWPDLKVYLTTTTEQTAVASICGPGCDRLVAQLLDDLDPDPETFRFMDWRDGHIQGVPVRVFRISFTGELSYEINIDASYGLWLWKRIFALGKSEGGAFDITPYGTEAMHVLRAEKGFIIVGQETDGTATPVDLGMDWIIKKSGNFVGRRSLSRSDTARQDRKQLVGVVTDQADFVLMEGTQIIATPEEGAVPVPMLGHVTSSYFSPNLGRSIAMAMIESGRNLMGQTLYASRKGEPAMAVRVVGTDFLKERDDGTI